MSFGVFIAGTLGFALMAALLYIWGYRKSRRTPRRLQGQIGRLIEERILELLRRQPEGASLAEIARFIGGISVGGQLQGYKLQVDDAEAAAQAVLQQMLVRGLLLEKVQGRAMRYVLRNIEG